MGRLGDWIGVSWHTFSTLLGAVTATGRDNAEVFQYFRPDFDLAWERQQRDRRTGDLHGATIVYSATQADRAFVAIRSPRRCRSARWCGEDRGARRRGPGI